MFTLFSFKAESQSLQAVEGEAAATVASVVALPSKTNRHFSDFIGKSCERNSSRVISSHHANALAWLL